MLPLLPWRKRVLRLTAKSPVPSSKGNRLASTLLRSRTPTWTCPSVTAKRTPATGKKRQPRAAGAWPTANSRQELWIEAAGQRVTALGRYVTHALRNITWKCWEYSITSIHTHILWKVITFTQLTSRRWGIRSLTLPGAEQDRSRHRE